MHDIHPESQQDAMESHPIFEFRMVEQKRKDEEKTIQKKCFMVGMSHA